MSSQKRKAAAAPTAANKSPKKFCQSQANQLELQATAHQPPVIDDNTVWISGDFEVITADDVRFMVPSCHLLSASTVWRDASSMCGNGNNSMHLTDEDFETAPVFRLFLTLVADGTLAEQDRLIPITRQLVRFLVKWECRAALVTVMLHLRERLPKDRVSAPRAFIAGAVAEDNETCLLAIEVAAEGTWRGRRYVDIPEHLGKSIWDGPYRPQWFREELPDSYSSTLHRAYMARDNFGEGLIAAFRVELARDRQLMRRA